MSKACWLKSHKQASQQSEQASKQGDMSWPFERRTGAWKKTGIREVTSKGSQAKFPDTRLINRWAGPVDEIFFYNFRSGHKNGLVRTNPAE